MGQGQLATAAAGGSSLQCTAVSSAKGGRRGGGGCFLLPGLALRQLPALLLDVALRLSCQVELNDVNQVALQQRER
jgi:hypothetical protein